MKEEKKLNENSKQPENKHSQDTPVNDAEDILRHVSDENLTAPEPNLLSRVQAAYRRRQSRKNERPSLPAALKFDNWTQTAALGVRGGIPRERQLLFSEGAFDLDVQIVKDAEDDTLSVRGQLLQMDDVYLDAVMEGIEIQLIHPDGLTSRRLTDEYGRFHFSNCFPGDYTLRVILDDHDIILESLAVKA